MIKTYGKVRISGNVYESLVPLPELKLSYKDKRSGIYMLSLETTITSEPEDTTYHYECPICYSRVIPGLNSWKCGDHKSSPRGPAIMYTCRTVLFMGAAPHLKSVGTSRFDHRYGQHLIPLVMWRKCIETIPRDDII